MLYKGKSYKRGGGVRPPVQSESLRRTCENTGNSAHFRVGPTTRPFPVNPRSQRLPGHPSAKFPPLCEPSPPPPRTEPYRAGTRVIPPSLPHACVQVPRYRATATPESADARAHTHHKTVLREVIGHAAETGGAGESARWQGRVISVQSHIHILTAQTHNSYSPFFPQLNQTPASPERVYGDG